MRQQRVYLLDKHITQEGVRYGRWFYAISEGEVWKEYYALFQEDELIACGTYNEADEYADFDDL